MFNKNYGAYSHYNWTTIKGGRSNHFLLRIYFYRLWKNKTYGRRVILDGRKSWLKVWLWWIKKVIFFTENISKSKYFLGAWYYILSLYGLPTLRRQILRIWKMRNLSIWLIDSFQIWPMKSAFSTIQGFDWVLVFRVVCIIQTVRICPLRVCYPYWLFYLVSWSNENSNFFLLMATSCWGSWRLTIFYAKKCYLLKNKFEKK